MTMATIIIWRNRNLGDVILSLPALRALRARELNRPIRLVGYPENWKILGDLVAAFPIEDPPLVDLLHGEASPRLGGWLRGVDRAVALTEHDYASTLERLGVPLVVQARPAPPPGVHAVAWLCSNIVGVDAVRADATPRLDLSDVEVARAGRVIASLGLERPVVIHPGAGESWKCWPPARYARLAEALVDQGQEVLLSVGPRDAETLHEIWADLRVSLPTIPRVSRRELAGLLAHARLFIGNDSGVTHLAAAVGARTLALFGPTDPASWAPRGDVRVLRACVARARPSTGIRVCLDPHCLEGLTVDEVVAAAHDCLARPRAEARDRTILPPRVA